MPGSPCVPTPRHPAETGRSRPNHGELHRGRSCKAERKKPGRKHKASCPALLCPLFPFRVWVTVWVKPLTHILTHIEKRKFVTKKHLKSSDFRCFLELLGGFETADLILTKDALYLLSYSSISLSVNNIVAKKQDKASAVSKAPANSQRSVLSVSDALWMPSSL